MRGGEGNAACSYHTAGALRPSDRFGEHRRAVEKASPYI